MTNKWIDIWKGKENRFDTLSNNDYKGVLIEMKRLAGWDCFGNGSEVAYEEFLKEYEYIKKCLDLNSGDNIFEVGCGAGSNLYLFSHDGVKVGGMDYAPKLIDSMRNYISSDMLLESIADEAINLPVEVKYNSVIASGVFKYFNSLDYARGVLDRMYEKASDNIGLFRNLPEEKKEEFLSWKRAKIQNYDIKYKDLPELFLPKNFLISWADEKGMEIEFTHHHIEGAWNDEFTFDCVMRKANDR